MFTGLRRRAIYNLAVNSQVESLVRRLDATDDLAYRAAQRYVAGRSLDEAMQAVRRLTGSGFGVSLDLFDEGVNDEAAIGPVVQGYREAAAALADMDADVYLEIVPSHLGVDHGVGVCRRHVDKIVEILPTGTRLEISAEESHRTPHIMDLTASLAADGVPVLATVQANLRRSPDDVDRLASAGVPIRLVKGAYLEPIGLAYDWGEPTDIAYLRLAHQVRATGVDLVLATHDPVIREALLASGSATVEMLLGVRENDARDLVRRGIPTRIYAPYGDSWFRYWMRRIAEAQGG